jgi:hypothetical protein
MKHVRRKAEEAGAEAADAADLAVGVEGDEGVVVAGTVTVAIGEIAATAAGS